MAGVKISQLPWNSALVGTEIVPIVQNGNNVKILLSDLFDSVKEIDCGTPSSTHSTDLISLQIRRGTASQWTTENPVLSDGELGYEKDTGFLKIGDGITPWNMLPYFNGSIVAPDEVLVAPRNSFTYNSGGGVIATVHPGKRILGVDVYVEVGWSSTDGLIQVGTASVPNLLMEIGGVDIMSPSIHSIKTLDKFLVTTDIIATVLPGTGGTAGEVFVVLTLEP